LYDTNKFLLVPRTGEPTSISAANVRNITLKKFGNDFMAVSYEKCFKISGKPLSA